MKTNSLSCLYSRNSMAMLAITSVVMICISKTSYSADYTYSGTTFGASVWNRPVENGLLPPDTLSGIATAVPYSTFNFSVGTAGSYNFVSNATNPVGWDNYLFLYSPAFNALQPLTNALIGNDDFPSTGVSGFSINLVSGVSYTLVTTGFDNTDAGNFTNTISGPGPFIVGTAPEPGSGILILAFAPAGALFLRKCRNR
jgi:hypothetical protein